MNTNSIGRAVALVSLAVMAQQAQASLETRFHKTVDQDGNTRRYINLGEESSTLFVSGKNNKQQTGISKIRFEPMTMELDLTDLAFVADIDSQQDARITAIDLSGTLFKFLDGSKVAEFEQGKEQETQMSTHRVKVQVDNDALMEKYQFVYDYAPRMWLCEDDDGWWPGSHQTFFDNMTATSRNHQLMATTKVPLKGPYDYTQDFLHGEKPSEGKSVPIMTFILPVSADQEPEMDPLEMLLNPEDTAIEASYIYFMPYDHVKEGMGNHVGDIEKTKVDFIKGKPTKVRASYHDWEDIKDYTDVEKTGDTHPVVYNAEGTHATYFSSGYHPIPIMDWTCKNERWDFWQDLDFVFPWDWISNERVIKTDDEVLNGVNYLTELYWWGNKGMGKSVAGQQQLKHGPDGYLIKFEDRKAELESLDYVCQGRDSERCPWPMGPFSQHLPLCENGYVFSYLAQKCFKVEPKSGPKCSGLINTGLLQRPFKRAKDIMWGKCKVKEGSTKCGSGFTDVCEVDDETGDCTSYCITDSLVADDSSSLDYTHMLCTQSGQWVDAATAYPQDVAEVTFAEGEFKCPFELY